MPKHDLTGPACLSILKRLAHTKQHTKLPIESLTHFFCQQLIGLSEPMSPFRVPNKGGCTATISQHRRRNLACESAFGLSSDILPPNGDPALGSLSHSPQVGVWRDYG